ncbi:hypothetical protein Tco_0002319 [Tanacetum coccineum]
MANNNNNIQGPPPAGPNFPALDLRPMEELLQAPTDGVGDAIVVPPFLLVRTSRNKPQASSASDSSSQNDAITTLSRQVDALSKQISSMNKPVHAVQEGCETCGGPHAYYECQAADGYTQDVYATTGNYNSGENKEKLEELPNTLINAECSAILLNKVSEKLGDPGKFLILCIAEDVIVKVDKFNFLADFVIVYFVADLRVPIILGRPFLRTVKALVGLYKEKLTLRIGNEELVFRAEFFLKNSPSHEQKSSGSTISHFDPSLLEYESFYFDLSIDPFPLAERSDFYPKEFTDELAHIISLPEYDHFYFDIEDDPGELTRLLKENISDTSTKDLTINELNDFPLLLSDCDSTVSEEFFEIDLLVSFPSRNKDKIFDPGIHYQRSPISEISYSSTGRFFYYLIR